MFNIYICDKNISFQWELSTVIKDIAGKKHDINITTFQSGEELLLGNFELADIIYIDVTLVGKLNGIETAKELRKRGCCSEIIFIASSDAYVYEAYDINPLPVQYLIKNKLTEEKFKSVFLRAVSQAQKKRPEVFTFKIQNVKKTIPLRDISHFMIKKCMVSVFYTGKEMSFRSSMLCLQEELPEKDFFRTHRAYIINFKYVSCIRQRSVILTTGQEVPIGITYAKIFGQEFSKYLEDSNAVKI